MASAGSRDGTRPRVLIAGGGVAALEGMLALRHVAGEGVEIELIAPEREFRYRALGVGEPFGVSREEHLDLGRLASYRGARHRLDALVGVDTAARRADLATGISLEYDALLVALGVRRRIAVPGAVTYRGRPDSEAVRGLLERLAGGEIRSLAFAVPSGCTWPLPAYELALLTASSLFGRRIGGRRLIVVTAEEQPLGVFGREASAGVRGLLEATGIELHTATTPVEASEGGLRTVPHGHVDCDAAIALPRIEGPHVSGLPHDEGGFIPVDGTLRVLDAARVWAAGDATTVPVKQGGLAAQEAEVAAEDIASVLGFGPEPKTFDPVLRATLMTGGEPRYLRAWIGGGHGDRSQFSKRPLWWPPSKVAGHYLSPYLVSRAGVGPVPAAP